MGNKTPRHVTAAEAASVVKPGDLLDYSALVSQPDVFDAALGARIPALRDLHIRGCLSLRPRAVLEADPDGAHVRWSNWHFSGYDRGKHDAGNCTYIPCNLGEIPDYYRRFLPPTDVAILKCCPMDADGFFNFGPVNAWMRAVVESARVVVVETSATLPYCFGERNGVHASEVDFVIEGDGRPAPELPSAPPTEVDRAVGRLIAGEIEDGSCLQIGVGGMPNAVCAMVLESGAKDLGIHTEMLNDGLAALYRAGRTPGSAKATYPGKVVYAFALGTQALFDTIHRNPDFVSLPVDRTNLPQEIIRNPRVVAINNTTQIDLQGQACSESDGHRHLTGTGGQLQFVRGAYASEGGKSFICLSSTYERRGARRSRIVLAPTPGNIVTTPRSDMMYVVTEYGIANLKGKSVSERATALIGLAHPDFREELERGARENGLIPRRFA